MKRAVCFGLISYILSSFSFADEAELEFRQNEQHSAVDSLNLVEHSKTCGCPPTKTIDPHDRMGWMYVYGTPDVPHSVTCPLVANTCKSQPKSNNKCGDILNDGEGCEYKCATIPGAQAGAPGIDAFDYCQLSK